MPKEPSGSMCWYRTMAVGILSAVSEDPAALATLIFIIYCIRFFRWEIREHIPKFVAGNDDWM